MSVHTPDEDTALMLIDDTFQRFARHDVQLLADLHRGDALTVQAVGRLLRMTPLEVLARHPGTLVEVLAALPELHHRLRPSWARQDAALTRRLLLWAEQTRRSGERRHADPLITPPV